MDDIREWISDNLRYILLGAGVLLLVILLFLILKGCGKSDKPAKTPAANSGETQQAAGETAAQSAQGIAQTEVAVALSEDTALITLMQSYYQALGAQDVDVIRTLVDSLTESDEAAIAAVSDVDTYSDVSVYSKPGPVEGTYVVYTKYTFKYANFNTVLPGISQMYVCTADDGSYYISNGNLTESVSSYLDDQLNQADVTALVDGVKSEYDAALAADSMLSGYVNSKITGISNPLYMPEGTVLTVKNDCNVRAGAGTNNEKVGTLTAGDTVTKTGVDGDWIQIQFGEQTAFVRYDMFE